MRTFASMAIDRLKIRPAIPGSVHACRTSDMMHTMSTRFSVRATSATRPAKR